YLSVLGHQSIEFKTCEEILKLRRNSKVADWYFSVRQLPNAEDIRWFVRTSLSISELLGPRDDAVEQFFLRRYRTTRGQGLVSKAVTFKDAIDTLMVVGFCRFADSVNGDLRSALQIILEHEVQDVAEGAWVPSGCGVKSLPDLVIRLAKEYG